MTTKVCSDCGQEKSIDNYYPDVRCRDGYRGQCRRCTQDKQNAYRKDPEAAKRLRAAEAARREKKPRTPEQNFKYGLWKNYRMRPEQYEAMLEEQGGKCAACGTTEPGGRGRFHVDHDHTCCEKTPTCGQCSRALLCSRCNPMIGMAGDDPLRLIAGAMYLIQHSGPALVQALGATV